MTVDAQRHRTVMQILLLSAGFFVLVAISVASVLLVNKSREDNAWVVHTVESENQISAVLLEVRRAESAVRAYLLSGGPQFLTEYQMAAANVLPAIDHLAELTHDNPAQIQNIAKLRKAAEQRLSEFARGAERVKNNDVSNAVTASENIPFSTHADPIRT